MNKLFYELKFSGRLPSPTGIGMRILQLTQQEDCGLDEITQVIRSDPSLTGRILKVASAGLVGTKSALPRLEEAVFQIGFATLRQLALGFSLVSTNPREACAGFDYPTFWHGSLGRAVAAQYLTELSGQGAASESYVCGLLGDVGRLGLAAAHPSGYSRVLAAEGAEDPELLIELETREFGIHHRELTAALLADWGFPEPLALATAAYRSTREEAAPEPAYLRRLRRILRVADQLVEALLDETTTAESLSDEKREALAGLDIVDGQVAPALAAIRGVWAEWGELLDVHPPRTPVRRGVGASRAAPVMVVDAADPAVPRDPTRVLLLADGDEASMGLETSLRQGGYDVTRARSARQAMDLAVSGAPSIVIACDDAGDTEAMDFCRALRGFEMGRRAYFLLATAHPEVPRLLAAFDVGVDDYLRLPCEGDRGLLRLRAARRILELREQLAEKEKVLQQNIAELAVANRKLHRAAMTDELTQLPNRRFAEETLREEWTLASVRGLNLSVILGDIDHFKRVNDTHGHLVGDLVLAAVARIFREELRAMDVACRIGGEEFLVICPNTDLTGALRCAERIRARVEAAPIEVSGKRHPVTISLGAASRFDAGRTATSVEGLLKAADVAAYASKAGGRNRVSVGRAA